MGFLTVLSHPLFTVLFSQSSFLSGMFSFFALQLCANFKLAIFGLVSRNTVCIVITPIIALIIGLTGTIREIDCKRVNFPDIFSVMQMRVMMGVLMKTGFLGFTTGMHKLGFC